MLKVENRAALRKLKGEDEPPSRPQPEDTMAGVHRALETLAAQVQQTSAAVAACMHKKEEHKPKEYVATVERDAEGRMKTVTIRVGA